MAMKVKLLFLDPNCADVSIKSAESDGVSVDWAHRHINDCKRCREYDELVRQKMFESAERSRTGNLARVNQSAMEVRVPKGIRHIHLDLT